MPDLSDQSFTDYQLNKNKEFDKVAKDELEKAQNEQMIEEPSPLLDQTKLQYFTPYPTDPMMQMNMNYGYGFNQQMPPQYYQMDMNKMNDIEEVGKWPLASFQGYVPNGMYNYSIEEATKIFPPLQNLFYEPMGNNNNN